MNRTDTFRPNGPATLVACPWCRAQVELTPEEELRCLACRVTVELAPADQPVRSPRSLAPAA
jgi:hypothetical protein